MAEQPNFRPLKITQTSRPPVRELLTSVEHLAIAVPSAATPDVLRLPDGKKLKQLLDRARKRNDSKRVDVRLGDDPTRTATLTAFEPKSTFASLTWARRLVADMLREGAGTIAFAALGYAPEEQHALLRAFVAAAQAAAFEMPSFKSHARPRRRLKTLKLFGVERPRIDLSFDEAAALGNNIARWFSALPPNRLTAASYREAIAALAKEHGLDCEFLDERRLKRLGAGAFLAVAQGNASRDAGIAHLRYRPGARGRSELALVGKGVLFDTGGTNLKPFKSMLDMHIDMQGSAVALGTSIALATLKVPYGFDAWLGISENRISATACKPQDVVRAVNGTTIQVIHTDAEGRMILADTLALAARAEPSLILDYATLTGACVSALTERYSGVFSNRQAASSVLQRAGAASGERVWGFPMDEDYDEALESEIADIKQCAIESYGDHILAGRFLSRFVPGSTAWVHIDLSAGQHKGGLAHVPTEITGFGVRLTLELLAAHGTPSALADSLGPAQ